MHAPGVQVRAREAAAEGRVRRVVEGPVKVQLEVVVLHGVEPDDVASGFVVGLLFPPRGEVEDEGGVEPAVHPCRLLWPRRWRCVRAVGRHVKSNKDEGSKQGV